MPLLHFLLIYDRNREALVETLELGEDAEAAARTYSAAEQEFRGQEEIEVVLVGAESLDTIRVTHSHYFDGEAAAEPFGELLAR
jgi:hypothetical protein